jgi:dTDP-4-amino-4,6-dideoxygalactose transaminase
MSKGRRKRPSLAGYAQAESIRLLRELTGRQHALLAGRGAAGIYAALRALGLRDEYILIPANTCYIVLWAVLRSGNKPMLIDVDDSGNVSLLSELPLAPDGKRPAAIIPCHMYGLAANMAEIVAWAKAHNLYVIEDAALALGAKVADQPAGSWGDVSIFSFGLGKIADNQLGGAVLTDDDRLAAEIAKIISDMPVWDNDRMALTNQWNALYWALHQYEAQNPGLPALYPALYELYGGLTTYQLPASYWDDLSGLLRDLPENLDQRAAIAAIYDDLSRDLPLRMLPRPEGSILWRYPLLVESGRDDLLQYLWENGVQDATRWYPSLRYMTAALAPHIPQAPTPVADSFGASIINLPLTDQIYAEKITGLIRDYYTDNL